MDFPNHPEKSILLGYSKQVNSSDILTIWG